MNQAPILLTPGPLTTSRETREAMLRDWGSRDEDFIALTRSLLRRLEALAGAGESHVCVPVQGSGTFAVEAMLGTLVPKEGHVLVAVNGAYGERMVRICETLGRRVSMLVCDEERPVSPDDLAERLDGDRTITHVAAVYCETTTGMLNPIEAIAEIAARRGRRLLIDAMSAFGALPCDAARLGFDGLAASANKCLEGVPGLAFVLCREKALGGSAGHSPSVSLDLHDQWLNLRRSGQWRFTPPTHVTAALGAALDQLDREGGPSARLDRYRRNWKLLVDGMRSQGFATLLPDALQAPIIVTFRAPAHPAYDFAAFAGELRRGGIAIYPGKLTRVPSFRIGCIGAIGEREIGLCVDAVARIRSEMGF